MCRAPIESSDGDGPEHAAITAGSTPDRQDASAANVREILRDPKHDRHHSNCKDEDYYHTRERDARSDHSSGASPRGAMSKPGPMVAAAGLPGFSSKLGGAGSPVVRLFDGEDELDIEGTVREDSNDFGRLL